MKPEALYRRSIFEHLSASRSALCTTVSFFAALKPIFFFVGFVVSLNTAASLTHSPTKLKTETDAALMMMVVAMVFFYTYRNNKIDEIKSTLGL